MRILRKLRRDAAGSLLIEMALVAPIFFLLLGAIIELGITLFTQSVLDGAARDAARLIRIGAVQGQTSPITAFQNQLCSELGLLVVANCSGGNSVVLFSVQSFSNFGAVSFPACTQNANQSGTGTPCPFQPGTAGQIVGVQVTYNRPFIIPWVGRCLTGGTCWLIGGNGLGGSAGTGKAELVSTVVFKNEPFP
jgi:Flp pilus assembly protein TadG